MRNLSLINGSKPTKGSADPILNFNLVLPRNLFAYAWIFVVDFKAVSTRPDSIFYLLEKGANKLIVPQEARDIRHSRLSCVMPGDKRSDLSIHQDERRLRQSVDCAEHLLAYSAPVHLFYIWI